MPGAQGVPADAWFLGAGRGKAAREPGLSYTEGKKVAGDWGKGKPPAQPDGSPKEANLGEKVNLFNDGKIGKDI